MTGPHAHTTRPLGSPKRLGGGPGKPSRCEASAQSLAAISLYNPFTADPHSSGFLGSAHWPASWWRSLLTVPIDGSWRQTWSRHPSGLCKQGFSRAPRNRGRRRADRPAATVSPTTKRATGFDSSVLLSNRAAAAPVASSPMAAFCCVTLSKVRDALPAVGSSLAPVRRLRRRTSQR